MHRHLCPCQAGVIALVACHQAGVVALIVMVSLPSMRRHLCCCYNCNCCPHDNGTIALVDAQGSLPLLSWCHCPCNNGIVALDLLWHCCPYCNGIVAVLNLALFPLLQWCHSHHQYAGFLAIIAMALLTLLQLHWCRKCAGVFAVDAMAIAPLVVMASLP